MPDRPHLIIIMADQLRRDFIGEFTPNINQLLTESTVFERAYCASPLCVPARGAFFTGRYPNETGCRINPWEESEVRFGEVKANTPNLYSLLENDWDSWHTGKQHFYTADKIDRSPKRKTHWLSLEEGYRDHINAGNARHPGGPTFKGILPELIDGRFTQIGEYSIPTTGCYEPGIDYFFDGYITQKSLEAIQHRDKNKPFLLNAMFAAPHPPLDIPEPWYSQVQQIELAENVALWSQGQSPLQLYNLPGYFGKFYSRDDWQEVWRVYAGLVTLLDNCVGQVLTALKDEKIYDDAVILFTADHGEMLGSHGLWQKMCMYEESAHVNLAIKSPKGCPYVKQSSELVSHIDILPTLCDLLGIKTPPNLPGTSLHSTLKLATPIDRSHIFIQFDGNGARGNFQRCIVHKNHKLIVDFFKDEIFFELYDLEDDPQEKYNLAFDEQKRVQKLIEILLRIMQDTSDEITFSLHDYDEFLHAYAQSRKIEPFYFEEGLPA